MNIIARYLQREFLLSISLVTVALLSIFLFFDLLGELDLIGKGHYGVPQALIYTSLLIPGRIYELLPTAALIGSLYALAQFSRYSEFVIFRVSGLSLYTLARQLVRIGAILAFIILIIGEFIAPLSEKEAKQLHLKATESLVAQRFSSGFWIKDEHNFINIEQTLPDGTLRKVHIYEIDDWQQLRFINDAESGEYREGAWRLTEVTQTELGQGKISRRFFAQATWKSAINPDLIDTFLVKPEKMSIWNLYTYILHLKRNRQDTTPFEAALWSKLVHPVTVFAMLLIALPFGLISQRQGGVGIKIAIGLILGLTYQIANQTFARYGALQEWPPGLNNSLPTVLYLLAALGALVLIEQQHTIKTRYVTWRKAKTA